MSVFSPRYRSRPEIIRLILEASKNSATRTLIGYHTNLNHREIQKYSHYLVELGLLEIVHKRVRHSEILLYQTSERGRKLLHLLDDVKTFLVEL